MHHITIPTPDLTPVDLLPRPTRPLLLCIPLYASWLVRRPCLQGPRVKDGVSARPKSDNPFGSEFGVLLCYIHIRGHSRVWGRTQILASHWRAGRSPAVEASGFPLLVDRPVNRPLGALPKTHQLPTPPQMDILEWQTAAKSSHLSRFFDQVNFQQLRFVLY